MAAVVEPVDNDTLNLPDSDSLLPEDTSLPVSFDGNLGADLKSSPLDENFAAGSTAGAVAEIDTSSAEKWPGWPGYCVFRLIVPVTKVGAIIGRKGEFIKKMCEETRARIKVLEGPVMNPDRIVLISGKEEPETSLAPAMDGTLRVFRRVAGLPDNDDDVNATGTAFCSLRLLVASSQAIYLIGKQGSLIKSIVENSGASVRVLSEGDNPFYAVEDERIVELKGEALKVLNALESVVGYLRKFLVDYTVVPLFEKQYLARISTNHQAETLADKSSSMRTNSQTAMDSEFPHLARRDFMYPERELGVEARIQPTAVSMYGQETPFPARRSPGLARVTPFVTQVVQTMQVPFAYAEDIIGVEGANIDYIRRTSGASITIQESPHPDEITVEIKGMSSQVETSQQLIQEFISSHKEPVSSMAGGYGRIETAGYVPTYPQLTTRKEPLTTGYAGSSEAAGYRPAYPQLGASSYTASSMVPGQTFGTEYKAPDAAGYSSFKL